MVLPGMYEEADQIPSAHKSAMSRPALIVSFIPKG